MSKAFETAQAIRAFALAGKAILTMESAITNTHFTFKITQAKDYNDELADRWFVGLLTGQDNETDYTYMGVLDGDGPHFRMTKGSKIDVGAPSVAAFGWAWSNIINNKLPLNLIVRHEGKCGRCCHTLTTPESIDTGFGPECSAVLGIEHKSDTPEPVIVDTGLKLMLNNALSALGTIDEPRYVEALRVFLNARAESAIEPPTMEEIDADVNAGKPVSLMDVVRAQEAARKAQDNPNNGKRLPKRITRNTVNTTTPDTADDVPIF